MPRSEAGLVLFSMANSKRLCQDDASYAPVGPHRHDLAAEGGQGLMQLAVVAPTGRQAAAAKCSTPGGRACRWRRGEPRRWARGARRANACRHHQSGPRARNPAQACWNSDCFVRIGSHCSCRKAGPFLTHIRWQLGRGTEPQFLSRCIGGT